MTQLTTNPYFKSLIPTLSDEEFAQLEENILSQGCRDAIMHWKGVIIDGHNRYAICQKHNLPYLTEKLRFTTKQDAAIWIIENQQGRRNLTDAARIRLALDKADLLREKARQNRGRAGCEPVHVRKAVADKAGVGEKTVYKFMKVRELADTKLMQQVESGEVKIGTAYRMVTEGEKPLAKPLEVITKTVEVLYSDDSDTAPDIGNPHIAMVLASNTDAIERMYRFIADNAGFVVGLGDDMERIQRRLAVQVERVDEMLLFAAQM